MGDRLSFHREDNQEGWSLPSTLSEREGRLGEGEWSPGAAQGSGLAGAQGKDGLGGDLLPSAETWGLAHPPQPRSTSGSCGVVVQHLDK